MGKRRTKTQQKRMYEAIEDKALKLSRFKSGPNVMGSTMAMKDYVTISKICEKYLKKLM